MYVLSAVYKAHVFQTNMNVFKDLLKKQKSHLFKTNMSVFNDSLKKQKRISVVNNQKYEIKLKKINSSIIKITLNTRHWYMFEITLLNSVKGNVIQSQVQ